MIGQVQHSLEAWYDMFLVSAQLAALGFHSRGHRFEERGKDGVISLLAQ